MSDSDSAMPAPDYAIVVPAYNEAALLDGTLSAIRQAMAEVADRRGELIVADNASTDATPEIARRHGAMVVHEPHRQIARNRNAGARAATAPYLIFVDADTRIGGELLRATLAALDDGIAFGGTRVAFDEPAKPGARIALAAWNGLSRTMTWACGAYVFCRREAFVEVGGFDERLYASEEIRLCNLLRRWARRHRRRGRILDVPIITSLRKTHWFSTWRLARMLVRFALCPWSVRQQSACWMWYERPEPPETRRPPDV